jgi:hypothetical protein
LNAANGHSRSGQAQVLEYAVDRGAAILLHFRAHRDQVSKLERLDNQAASGSKHDAANQHRYQRFHQRQTLLAFSYFLHKLGSYRYLEMYAFT